MATASTADDLELFEGVTWRVALDYTDGGLVPISLAGYRGHMQVRYKVGAPLLLDLTTENGGLFFGANGVLNVAAGHIEIYAGASETAGVAKNGVYDLHLISLTDPDEVLRVFGGDVIVTRAVTVEVVP